MPVSLLHQILYWLSNAITEEFLCQPAEGALKRGKKRMPGLELCVGIGSKCMTFTASKLIESEGSNLHGNDA